MNDYQIIPVPTNDSECDGCVFYSHTNNAHTQCAISECVDWTDSKTKIKVWDCLQPLDESISDMHLIRYKLVHKLTGQAFEPEELVQHYRNRDNAQ